MMKTPSHCLVLLVCACLAAGSAPLVQRFGQPASADGADAAMGATIESLAFLAGAWSEERDGMYIEEIWSPPRGNNIIGSFRWLRPDGKPILFEILAITEEDGVLRLRLRHYSATLVGKEPPDKPMTLRLSTLQATRAVFKAEKDADDLSHVEYHVEGGTLKITVAFAGEDREPLVFRLSRVR
jgi:hypothetical protein